ncbi:molybdenum cofactor biosynthesis protein MoaE [Mariniluteicoccus endophyticus]
MPQPPAPVPTRVQARLETTPLSVDALLSSVQDERAGAVATFLGTVRDADGGRGVAHLDYTAHPSALAELQRVADDVAGRHDVVAVSVDHRVGHLEIGDLAVVIAVSAVHRAPALEACRDLIDTLKARVPIWKKQAFTEGDTEWVGLP